MKKLLIIYPHWPPSNLAGVHRPRLIANYLKDFDWQTTVLTVDEKYYEKKLDYSFSKTVSDDIIVFKTAAKKISKPRLIGDIGLRAFSYLYKRAKELIEKNNYNFIWIPIPSFYTAILGRFLYDKFQIPYGIDYIDPWIRDIHNRKNIRSISSLWLAKMMEPYAVKKASLISGVSLEYYKPVLQRNFTEYLYNRKVNYVGINPNTEEFFTDVEMPYGFDPNDHKIELQNIEFPWKPDQTVFLYAGAFLPNSRLFIENFMKVIKGLSEKGIISEKHKFYFLGTGNYPGTTIREYADRYGIEKYIVEIRDRFKFLEILNFLTNVEGVMIFGSTEKHYTASKTFQSLMSNKRVFSMFHEESSAIECLRMCNADRYSVLYNEGNNWKEQLQGILKDYIRGDNWDWKPDLKILEDKFSSKVSAKALVDAIESVLPDSGIP